MQGKKNGTVARKQSATSLSPQCPPAATVQSAYVTAAYLVTIVQTVQMVQTVRTVLPVTNWQAAHEVQFVTNITLFLGLIRTSS